MVLSSRRQQLDFLGHVAHKRAPRPVRAIGPVGHRRPQREDDGHAFPLERLGDLIANEPSVVKRMIFIELAFGGPRISEALNHFVTDVLPGTHRPKLFPDDRPTDLPLVVLADPVASVFTDTLQFSTEDRRQYLRRRFDMLPRPDRPRRGDPLHAGWKGMLYDNTNLLVSQVYWSHPEWARTYWRLYGELLEIRRSVPKGVRESHPYLYINDSPHRPEFGQPVKIHAIEKAFVRACERIGLEPYRGKISLHGLRHAYKRQLRMLGLKSSTRQRCMHHVSPDSQDIYDKAAAADINAALQAVRGRMGNRDVSFHMKDAAVVTVGEGTGREVLVNPSFNAALLLEGWPSNERMLALIEGFERALYPAVRSLLKARRGDITIDKDSNIILDAPYFSAVTTKPTGRP